MLLRHDAIAVWNAGVAAVDSARSVQQQIRVDQDQLWIGDVPLPLSSASRIEVIGAGKAGAGMARGAEDALLSAFPADRISGWINVPADCVKPLRCIHLHAARPPGLNEPTQAAVDGTREILRRVQSLTAADVCVVLLSGGASALLCSPAPGISLSDKLSVTRILAGSGAPIQELNLVRTQLSRVKGGRLAAACSAGTLVALIISDVIGDPLEIIASGPTTAGKARAADALQILGHRNLLNRIPRQVLAFLERQTDGRGDDTVSDQPRTCRIFNRIVASNAMAIDAAAAMARNLGYEVHSLGSANAGDAAGTGRQLMSRLLAIPAETALGGVCLLSGGEPTVNLADSGIINGRPEPMGDGIARGGRNQELVLAAVAAERDLKTWKDVVLLSGGTDGEDGPTDAAGAFADEGIVAEAINLGLDPARFLLRHSSYDFFEAVNGLLKTGPTHTNVMDLRVGLRRTT